jgi:hypothetical protein
MDGIEKEEHLLLRKIFAQRRKDAKELFLCAFASLREYFFNFKLTTNHATENHQHSLLGVHSSIRWTDDIFFLW